jgi:hypothetical protein
MRGRMLYLMPAALITFSFELSSAMMYLSISAGAIGISRAPMPQRYSSVERFPLADLS